MKSGDYTSYRIPPSCRAHDAGTLVSAVAYKIIGTLPETYWETSPSGTGLHGIFCAKRTFPPISQPGTEVYSDNHFMSVTGLCFNGVSAIAKVTPRTFDFIRKPAEPVVSPSNDASKVYSGLGADIVIESFHQ